MSLVQQAYSITIKEQIFSPSIQSHLLFLSIFYLLIRSYVLNDTIIIKLLDFQQYMYENLLQISKLCSVIIRTLLNVNSQKNFLNSSIIAQLSTALSLSILFSLLFQCSLCSFVMLLCLTAQSHFQISPFPLPQISSRFYSHNDRILKAAYNYQVQEHCLHCNCNYNASNNILFTKSV